MYCHDNEHSRYIDHTGISASAEDAPAAATGTPFANLKALLKRGGMTGFCDGNR